MSEVAITAKVYESDDEGDIFHTYSTYARGLDIFLTTYHLLDIVPKGRDEEGFPGMSWLRHRDRYDDKNFVDPWNEKPARARLRLAAPVCYLRCLLTSLVISNIETLDLPPNTALSLSSALMLRRFFLSWRPFRLM